MTDAGVDGHLRVEFSHHEARPPAGDRPALRRRAHHEADKHQTFRLVMKEVALEQGHLGLRSCPRAVHTSTPGSGMHTPTCRCF
ncbi:hypothetical protein [Nonomuraea rubra]|uniref:hypothetical protein n=1 Tax=Nonomuraea rubra TaxID=46180 RepID=UPI003CD0A798